MSKYLFACVLVCFLGLLSLSAQEELTALKIVQNADDIRGAKDWGFHIDVIDYQKEGEQNKILSHHQYRVTARTFGDFPDEVYKSVAFFLSPKNVEGQKNLKEGQVYWQFFPDTKNLVRISGAQRMAGQVSAADIASSNYQNDYVPTLQNEEEVLGKPCYKLELMQKNDQVAYHKLHYWVDKETFWPVKVMYYADSGKLLKTAYYRDFKMALGKLKPHELFIVDPLNPGHVTRMLYSKLCEEKMDEIFFRKANLVSVQAPEEKKEELTALKIIQNADDVRGAKNWGFKVDVIDYQKEGEQNKILSHHQYRVTARTFGEFPDEVYKSVAFFLSPKNVEGQKNLKEGQVYWQFFPDTKNLVRISGAQRMAGQVSAADIASSNYQNDYVGTLQDEEAVLGKACYKLELMQKNDQVAYYKLMYWVDKADFSPVKVMFYAESGKLLKTAYFRDFKPALGQVKPHELFIVDPLNAGHVTRMLYSDLKTEEMPEIFFRKANLTNVQAPQD